MESEHIGVVLAKASELRSKVSLRVHDKKGEDGEKGRSLAPIGDALASLEQQLSSLQNMQQQQQYERETTLAQIDRSRVILLRKLKEYRGTEFELIHEAAAFAGEAIKHDDDLLLPPYPRDVIDDLHPSNFVRKQKSTLTRSSTSEPNEDGRNSSDVSRKRAGSSAPSRCRGLKVLAGFVVKSALTILGGFAILTLSGYETKIGVDGFRLKPSEPLQKSDGGKNLVPEDCPPGKLLVVENGEARCVVKERVEIPFDSNVASPNLSYGFG